MNTVNRILGEAMTAHQQKIYQDPEKAVEWADKHEKRFPEAEPYIAKDPVWAYVYAVDVLKHRWPEAEPYMAKKTESVYNYALRVINGRFPEGESTIAKNPKWALWYARDIIKGRFLEAEETIVKSEYKEMYLKDFPEARDDWIMMGWNAYLD